MSITTRLIRYQRPSDAKQKTEGKQRNSFALVIISSERRISVLYLFITYVPLFFSFLFFDFHAIRAYELHTLFFCSLTLMAHGNVDQQQCLYCRRKHCDRLERSFAVLVNHGKTKRKQHAVLTHHTYNYSSLFIGFSFDLLPCLI
jgi:hypothetical protein